MQLTGREYLAYLLGVLTHPRGAVTDTASVRCLLFAENEMDAAVKDLQKILDLGTMV